jgi:hypothetical protein
MVLVLDIALSTKTQAPQHQTTKRDKAIVMTMAMMNSISAKLGSVVALSILTSVILSCRF